MTDREFQERRRVMAEARKWLGTPYHHRAHVLGSGVDCLYLLVEAFRGAGLVNDIDPGIYSKTWFLHRSEEQYLEGVGTHTTLIDKDDTPLKFRDPFPEFLAGDILMFRHGRTFSHSALVTDWPYVIHASAPSQCVEEIRIQGTSLERRKVQAFSYWGPR